MAAPSRLAGPQVGPLRGAYASYALRHVALWFDKPAPTLLSNNFLGLADLENIFSACKNLRANLPDFMAASYPHG